MSISPPGKLRGRAGPIRAPPSTLWPAKWIVWPGPAHRALAPVEMTWNDWPTTINFYLVGGLEHDFFFPIIYGMSSFPLTNIFRGVGIPPTRYPLVSFKMMKACTTLLWCVFSIFFGNLSHWIPRLDTIAINRVVFQKWPKKNSGGKRRTTLLIADEMNSQWTLWNSR